MKYYTFLKCGEWQIYNKRHYKNKYKTRHTYTAIPASSDRFKRTMSSSVCAVSGSEKKKK